MILKWIDSLFTDVVVMPEILEKYVEVPDKINCYNMSFFHYFKGTPKPDKLDVHYLIDSNHQWKYGHPTVYRLF